MLPDKNNIRFYFENCNVDQYIIDKLKLVLQKLCQKLMLLFSPNRLTLDIQIFAGACGLVQMSQIAFLLQNYSISVFNSRKSK